MTVTREDREAAVRHRYRSFGPAYARAWAESGDDVALVEADEDEAYKLARDAEHFARHRFTSTQALREAAERLCNHIDAMDADQWARGWDAEARRLRDSLTSALAGSPAQEIL